MTSNSKNKVSAFAVPRRAAPTVGVAPGTMAPTEGRCRCGCNARTRKRLADGTPWAHTGKKWNGKGAVAVKLVACAERRAASALLQQRVFVQQSAVTQERDELRDENRSLQSALCTVTELREENRSLRVRLNLLEDTADWLRAALKDGQKQPGSQIRAQIRRALAV